MFPGGNTNANLGYSKHNQYMAQPPHFLAAPGRGPGPVPGSAIGNPLGAASSVMPLNMQGGIDWAQLAQQWIHMRDSPTAPPMANFSMNMPIAPPPPIISNTPEYHQHQHHQHQQQPALRLQPVKSETHYEEHGEAEMDMDMDEEENENNVRATHHMESMPPPPVVTQSQWLAGSANDVPVAVPSIDAVGVGTQQWNDWSTRNSPTSHIPSLLKLNVCNPNESTQIPLPTHQPPQNNISAGGGTGSVSSEIDANKRKMLPAWIREGLEKMEREKQRQLEQQQQRSSPEVELPSINVKQVSSKTLTTTVNLLNMSNVASDSEDSIAAPEEASYAPNMAQLLGNDVISKPSNSDEEQEQDDNDKDNQQQQLQDSVSQHNVATVARAANAEAALSGKSYEERLADLMLVVRRTLTEILLETTNEEIAAIATETLKAHRAKASSAQVIRKSALSSITGNLGLAVYGDSSSDSENDESADDNDGGQVGRIDSSSKDVDKYIELSMDELKARIRKSKRAFERVIDDIEERVSLQEQTDEQNLQYHRKLELEKTEAARQRTLSDHRLTDMSAGNVTAATVATTASTNDKLHQFNVKRLSRKERTTRFSDNKDGKQPSSFVSQVAAVAPAPSSSVIPQQLKPVPNPATNLLQIPESMASMLDAANKALDKAQKTSKKSKSRRRQSSSSSSSSSDDSCSSRSSKTNTSSNSSKSSKSPGSSTRSSAAAKKQGRSSNRHSRGSTSHRQRIDSSRKGHRKDRTSSSRQSYERHRSSHESRERERERDRERHGQHYSSQQQHHRRRHRDSSNSASEDGGSRSYRPGSRHGSSRSHQSSSYSKHRERTRSRSNSRSTHNSHSSVSSSHQHRKRN